MFGSPNTLFTVYWFTCANIFPLMIWVKNQIPRDMKRNRRKYENYFSFIQKMIYCTIERRMKRRRKKLSPAKFQHSKWKRLIFPNVKYLFRESKGKPSVWLWNWMFESGLELKEKIIRVHEYKRLMLSYLAHCASVIFIVSAQLRHGVIIQWGVLLFALALFLHRWVLSVA